MKLTRILRVIVALLVVAAGFGFWLRPVSYFNRFVYLRSWLQGAESHEVAVAGYRIHYNVLGPASGAAVVLLHGLGGRAEDWQNLAPYFAKAGFRVYMPDLPGFGRSEQPTDFSYSVRDQAGVVVGFLDAMGLKQVDLGGWSMGGWIAQRVAIGHGERVRRLILIDSAGLAEAPEWDTRLFSPTTPAELDQLDALLMPNPPVVPGFIARDIVRISKQKAWVIQRAVATMLTGHDTTDSALPKLKMKVLIVWGTEDQIFPLRLGERMQRLIPQARLERMVDCGHLAPEQCAEKMGPKVVGFVME
jgi:pimeloyl-ACP methyl ester carboxylesterase